MSRILRLVLTGLASTALACGSSSPTNGSTAQAFDGEQCDGNRDATNCKPAPPPSETGPCFQAELNGSMCLSPDAWKHIASAACGAQGASLSSLTAGASCGGPTQPPQPNDPTQPPKQPNDPNVPGGTDGNTDDPGTPTDGNKPPPGGTGASSTGIRFTCCVATQPPTQPPSPCVDIPFDVTTNADSTQAAALVCRERGLELSGTRSSASDQQPGTSDQNIAICCGPTQPPPSSCITVTVGDAQTCSTKEVLSTKASAICAQQGLGVGSINITPCSSSGQNDTDGALIAEVQCCKDLAQPQDEQKP